MPLTQCQDSPAGTLLASCHLRVTTSSEAALRSVRVMQHPRSAGVLALFRAASTAVMPASPPAALGAAAGTGFPRASNRLPAAGGGGGCGPAGRLGAPAVRS